MEVARRTLLKYGGGFLVVSGDNGEAERLARLARSHDRVLETTAQNTWENVERSIPDLEEATLLAIATDWFHARRAGAYLRQMRPDLATRLVSADRPLFRGLWIQVGGALYEALLTIRRSLRW
jgi:uncharacterized SAM-binding protein YcdF (DUF218 family)